MTNNQLTENSVNQLLNSIRLARDNAERADNRVDHSFYYALTIALEELQERRKAAMDSEAVAEVLSNRPGNDTSTIDMALPVGTRLYRHAQPAPVVPDAATAIRACLSEFPESARDIVEECADIAENACRAAMLQDEPVTTANKLGNSPVIPDTWIPVSERLPEEGGRYWCYVGEQNDLGKSYYQWNCSWNGERWWVESENGGIVTHWMPLPAAPQEVNHG
ncbi:TPA: DUF551 domain-containing protein [Klebsiella aerogenes]|nr:DUF551 domain-containing protein [Klebsiella aerogenes]